jgi:serine/threonine protein kinase
MNAVKRANAEPIPGYRLIAPLGSGGFGEVWTCEAPGGLFKAIKFVRGEGDDIHPDGLGAKQELKALQHVKTLRHPFLLSMDRVEFVDGELVIVMELADRSLHDLLEENRAAGRAGVPREELLRYFAETAEVLDLLNQEHGLQHLDIKPRNLFLVGRHIKVADFGLVNSVAEMTGSANAVAMAGATPVYAAPESFLGKITSFSDQYSLAIAYHELLVGEPPFVGKNFRQLALQHMQAEANLSRLPEADRPVVARALAKDPGCRFPSCSAFIHALQAGAGGNFSLPPLSSNSRNLSDTRTDISIASLSCTPLGSNTRPEMRAFGEIVLDIRQSPTNAEAAVTGNPAGSLSRPSSLAGYQFLERLAYNAAGETWTARADDGRDRLVRFFFGISCGNAKDEERLSLLRKIRHDSLEPMELVGDGDNRLALVTDACATTLISRLRECQADGLPGIPRPELLDWLGEAAEALDDLAEKFGVRHLALTPRHLVLKNDRVRLLHFGVAELIPLPAGQRTATLSSRYSAPELLEGPAHPSSDAYSLALIYCELLTGSHPLRNSRPRQAASSRSHAGPDLDMVPATDREVIQRALDADPDQRFHSCADFMDALANGTATESATSSHLDAFGNPSFSATAHAQMRQHISDLVASATGDLEVRERHNVRYLLRPGRILEHQFLTQMAPGVAQLRVEGFRLQWDAALVEMSQKRVVLLFPLMATFWQRLRGAQPGLKTSIDMPPPDAGAVSEVRVLIQPVGCGQQAALSLMEEKAPELLESLRAFFQAKPEQRAQVRLPFDQIVQVSSVLDDCTMGAAVVARARDISLYGLGIYMPCEPSSQQVNILLPGYPSDHAACLPASVVRVKPCEEGYDVGLRFLIEEEPQEGVIVEEV